MQERRGAKRVSANLTARWHSPIRPHEGKIIELSTGGCFILTTGRPSVNKLSRVNHAPCKEAIVIEVRLSPDEWLELRAEIVYKVERVGFAARFVDLTPVEEQTIRSLMEKQEARRPKSLPFRTVGKGHRR